MKPIISSKGKLTQLRYELPHRVHDAKAYPAGAPNGSTIVLYAYDSGVGVVWRGGRPLKQSLPPSKQPAKPAKVNGTSKDAFMIVDSDDDEPSQAAPPAAEFEDEEQELDPDAPYPSIVQKLRLSLNTEVLHIAVPLVPAISTLRTADTVPPIFSKKIVFAVACADYSVRVITLPLTPPSNAAKEASHSSKSQWGEEVVRIPAHAGHQSIPRGITMTWTSRAEPTFDEEQDDEMDVDDGDSAAISRRPKSTKGAADGWDLLVASHSTELGGLLKMWRFSLGETSIPTKGPIVAYQTLPLRKPATRISFNSVQYPKRRHSQILIADGSGITRIYDPFAPSASKRRRNSQPGAYVALFRSTFEQSKGDAPPILAARKPILDAAWAADGQSILALLADGEWGIWAAKPSSTVGSADPSGFTVRGFVGTQDGGRGSGNPSSPKRNGRGALVPMTPNTRKNKEEVLFQGVSASPASPTRGGISVASLLSATGDAPEDSVVIWYGSDAYRIPNLAQHLSRATSRGGSGSLSAPAVSQIQGLALHGEAITSINQFDTTAREARLAIPRDVLVSAEHRLLIATNTTKPLGRDLNAGFEKERVEEEETRRFDQALLEAGELDLGGMDRLLDSMEGSVSASRSLVLGNPRKVLFASSTS
ncbi:hypothetical protein BDV96DRAFT_483137 [Lophiotrema nucula]|uniref:Nucleoporin NUP37 n=1 Tax=Lophiotrema nucula TaxID=690887 RepID=A0A6A5ZS55_9PLEO|nr:hypothetical protein BDV96DRAFT_483137 [Lophiotrema nucula]